VTLLVEAGADTLAQDTLGGRTPLHLAAWHRKERAVAKLLELGDPRQCHVLDSALGRAPLHLAAWQGHLRIVQLLLKVRALTWSPVCPPPVLALALETGDCRHLCVGRSPRLS
jgi:ankyrin repeat protein